MRIKELDGLRGIAIILVLCYHYCGWFPLPALRHDWFNLLLMPIRFVVLIPRDGYLGVMLFFVLSGYLITTILLDLRGKKHYFGVFYARRALRILPPYVLGMVVYIVCSIALGKPGSLGLWLRYIFFYSSLIPNLPRELGADPPLLPKAVVGGLLVLWSLSVEELYYTFWAPLVRYVSGKVFVLLIAAMILTVPLLRYLLYIRLHWDATFTFYCQMDGLAYGSAVALLMRARQLHPSKWVPNDKYFDGLGAIIVASTVLFFVLNHWGVFSSTLAFTFSNAMANLSFSLIVYATLRKSGTERRWLQALRAPWLRSVGKVSYSLYLFHVASLVFVGSLLLHLHLERHVMVVSEHLLGLLLSLGVAYGLWYALESPILGWKDRVVPSVETVNSLTELQTETTSG